VLSINERPGLPRRIGTELAHGELRRKGTKPKGKQYCGVFPTLPDEANAERDWGEKRSRSRSHTDGSRSELKADNSDYEPEEANTGYGRRVETESCQGRSEIGSREKQSTQRSDHRLRG
jgi:hypothetical protein